MGKPVIASGERQLREGIERLDHQPGCKIQAAPDTLPIFQCMIGYIHILPDYLYAYMSNPGPEVKDYWNNMPIHWDETKGTGMVEIVAPDGSMATLQLEDPYA